MISDPSFYIAAFFGVLLTGISKSGFGGIGGMAVPLMALTIPPPQAAAIMLPILLVMDTMGLVVFRGQFDRTNLRIIIPGAIIGITLGALTFGLIDPRWIRGIIGLESILFAVNRFRTASSPVAPQPISVSKGWFWGTVSGFTSFISHAGGPPIAQFLLPQGLDKMRLVGTMVVFFSVVNFVKLLPYGVLGLLDLNNLATSTALLPIVPLGYWIGLKMLRGLDQDNFNRILTWLMLLTGIKLLWDGLFGG